MRNYTAWILLLLPIVGRCQIESNNPSPVKLAIYEWVTYGDTGGQPRSVTCNTDSVTLRCTGRRKFELLFKSEDPCVFSIIFDIDYHGIVSATVFQPGGPTPLSPASANVVFAQYMQHLHARCPDQNKHWWYLACSANCRAVPTLVELRKR